MAPRKLNWKPLVALGIVLGTLAGVTHLVHGFQMERHAQHLREQARDAEQAGQFDHAFTYLQRYLQFRPGDLDAMEHCGELLERTAVTPQQRQRIVNLWQQVIAREPFRFDTRRRLARELIQQGACAEARPHLSYLLEHRPGNSDDEAMMGLCLERFGEAEPAAAVYQQAITRGPSRRDVYVRLAALFDGPLRQPQKAAAVMDRMVEADKDGGGRLERALYRMDHDRLDLAAEDLAKARERLPEDLRVLLASADLATRRGQFEEARTWLGKVLERAPTDANAYLALASVEVRSGRPTDAINCLHRGLEKLPDHPDLLAFLADVHIDRKEEKAASEIIAQLRQPGFPRGLADYLEGRRLLSRREWAAGLKVLGEVMELGELSPALAARAALAVGDACERLGDADRRLAALQKAVKIDGTSGAVRLALAGALEAVGRSGEALEQWRQAVDRPRPPEEARVLLARALVRRNESLPPPKRDWSEIDRLLDRAAQLPKQAAAAALVRAEAQAARTRPDEARTTLQEALKRDPNQPGLWAALADVAARQGDLAGARRTLADARRQLGDGIELRLAEVELCTREGRDAAASLRAMEQGLRAFSAEQQDRLLCGLAARWFDLGEVAEGTRLCRRLAATKALDWGQRLPLLDLVLQSGDDVLIAAVIADLRHLEGEDGTWWRYGEAARRLAKARSGDARGLHEAETFLNEAGQRRPNWSRVALLRASLADLGGDMVRAADAYLAAFDLGERQPGVVQRLVGLLLQLGRDDAADLVLRRMQQHARLTGGMARMAAEVALRLHNFERAAEMAVRVVPADGKDYRDQVWLGQVLALAGQRTEAEEALRRAVHLAGELPEPWIALVAFLARSGQTPAADAALADMQGRLSADQRPLALAVCCEALARFSEALRHYRAALELHPNDGLVLQRAASFFVRLDRPNDSVPLLRRLLEQRIQVPDANRTWSRRQLALALAFSGDEAAYREAVALLQGDASASRARDLVAATQAEGRAEALARLETSFKALLPTADELFCLVKLYEKAGDATRVRDTLIEALTLDMHNPEYLAYHIAALLRRGKRDEARPWVERLERVEPGSERVRTFRSALTTPSAG